MSVSITLVILGTEEQPLWSTILRRDWNDAYWRHCCEGHHTPEAAAAHGTELVAAWLGQYARDLKPPTCGALALASA